MSDRKMSGYQKNVQRIAILENAIKEALEMMDPTNAINQAEFITLATNAKWILINAIMKECNL